MASRDRVLVALLFGLAATASAAEEAASILEDSAPVGHVDASGAHRESHQLLLHHRSASRRGGRPDAASADVGDVAVIADNGRIVLKPRPESRFDLTAPTSLRFTPQGDGFRVTFADTPLDGSFGPELPLADDDTAGVAFPAGFPFLGATYTSIWVNSDGNVTLGFGDSASTPRDAARLIGGPPRVAPLLADLDPSSAGSVHLDARPDRLVVTWSGVTEFGLASSSTFQAILHADGRIDFVYDRVDAPFAVVGVAEGGDEGPFAEIDLTDDLPGTFVAGAIFQEFAPARGKEMDALALAKEFYKTHEDRYDFLVMFTDFVVDIGSDAFAFHLGIQNRTSGIGRRVFDATDRIGPEIDELESILNMNRIGLYWPDERKLVDPPIKKFRFPGGAAVGGPPGAKQISQRARLFGTLKGDFGRHGSYTLGLNSAMSVMAQETGHRWLAFVPFAHPTTGVGADSLDLLGRDGSHWSFFHDVRVPAAQLGGDPRASSAEGNAIVDLGPDASAGLPAPCTEPGESTFLTEPDELVDGYTELDQYLMGLRTATEVGPFWYVDEPRSALTRVRLDGLRALSARDDVLFCGKRVELTVQHIVDFPFPNASPRVPPLGDEVDTCGEDRKTMAFILLVEQGSPASPAHASSVRRVDTFRRAWERYANGPATGGRGRFDTRLRPECF